MIDVAVNASRNVQYPPTPENVNAGNESPEVVIVFPEDVDAKVHAPDGVNVMPEEIVKLPYMVDTAVVCVPAKPVKFKSLKDDGPVTVNA